MDCAMRRRERERRRCGGQPMEDMNEDVRDELREGGGGEDVLRERRWQRRCTDPARPSTDVIESAQALRTGASLSEGGAESKRTRGPWFFSSHDGSLSIPNDRRREGLSADRRAAVERSAVRRVVGKNMLKWTWLCWVGVESGSKAGRNGPGELARSR